MTIPGRSWIVPMSMTLVLAGGCSTVDQVTGMFGGSGRPDDGRAQAGRSFVGERAAALDGDLARLRQTQKDRADATGRLKGQAAAETAAYNGTVQDIAERLQGGAGALDAKLLSQWTEARSHLARVDEIVARMRALDADLGADRARGRFLADTARSLSEVGGASESEAAKVREVQAGLGQTASALDATGNELAGEIRTQTEWLATERRRSDTLLAAVRAGTAAPRTEPAAGRAAALPFAGPAAAPPATAPAPAPVAAAPAAAAPVAAALPPAALPAAGFRPTSVDGRRPFVAIRFDTADTDYERGLYEALKVAVDRDPGIRFDVVDVTSKGARTTGKRGGSPAERVAKSMVAMGLAADQVRTYGRTQNGLREPQVHIYVRRR